MCDAQSTINAIINEVNDAVNWDTFHRGGRVMYMNYCLTCNIAFNMFDLVEKHHHALKTIQELAPYYTLVREKLRKILDEYDAGLCRCDTGETMVAYENRTTGDVIQYEVWSHHMFLHYDYLRLDPMDIMDRCFTTHYAVNVIEDTKEDDVLPTYEEAQYYPPPMFTIDEDIPHAPATPEQNIRTAVPDAPQRHIAHENVANEDGYNARRRLDFDDVEVQEEHTQIDQLNTGFYAAMADDMDDEGFEFTFEEEIEVQDHPILVKLLQAGAKPLPPLTQKTSIYSSDYRIRHRISKQNFLIKTYNTPIDETQRTTIRVYRDIPAITQEIKLWFDYFMKPHATTLNTTMLSLRYKTVGDCMFTIAQYMD